MSLSSLQEVCCNQHFGNHIYSASKCFLCNHSIHIKRDKKECPILVTHLYLQQTNQGLTKCRQQRHTALVSINMSVECYGRLWSTMVGRKELQQAQQ